MQAFLAEQKYSAKHIFCNGGLSLTFGKTHYNIYKYKRGKGYFVKTFPYEIQDQSLCKLLKKNTN